MFERDGIISEEKKKTIGVSTNLDEQQANDLQDWFCLRENSSVSSFRCMDSILNLMEDDVIYHLNDFFSLRTMYKVLENNWLVSHQC